MENNNKIKTEHRLSILEANYRTLYKKVDSLSKYMHEFVDNHFNTFRQEVYKKIDASKGVPVSITIIIGLFSTLLTGLVMWIITR